MNIQIFDFEDQPIRTLCGDDGEPWWVAADVCRVVGIVNTSDALSKLDEDQKGIGETDTLGGKQQVNTVNEAGLYELVFRSNKEDAKRFRKWITTEVLPTIRKTGSYSIGRLEPEYDNTDEMSVVLSNMLRQRTETLMLKRQQEAQWEAIKATNTIAIEAKETAEAVEASYTGRTGFKTCLGYSILKGYKIERKDLATIGRKISKYCRDAGIDRKEVEDEHFDTVKSYPLSVLKEHDALFRHYNAA